MSSSGSSARTRFAPSPTGPLHLGHAFSALTAAARADALGGTFLLRIEDIDRARSRPDYEAAIFDDLAWLGLRWPEPVMRQSERMAAYQAALAQLAPYCYPCRCSRADIRAALTAPQEGAPPMGPDGLIYPGTCRGRSLSEAGPNDTIRLNMRAALAAIDGADLRFDETGPLNPGTHVLAADTLIHAVGDIVLARRDMGTSYHLSVVVDDAAQEITEVVRGADLFDATAIHVVLQALLDLPRPRYHHHRLIRDAAGKRLAKRDDARAIARYRDEGYAVSAVRAMIGLTKCA
ncbi:MAG: tRNA glutamyl-Q(34) synthetase GluQRS [Pseudomonadota bacterium]